jgi:tRNA-Thr(GGU) m(6)t(6)A37 methyltransferase TsaA
MTGDDRYQLCPIGYVESPLTSRAIAPLQGTEGSPDAWLVLNENVSLGITDLHVGTEVFVLTWLHLAARSVLRVHPRGNPYNAEEGVFSTRSPDRPNPIGLHRVEIIATEPARIQVGHLEAINGTPILDIKPILNPRDR